MFTDVKVSIIVPVFNVEKYLAECLDSLINQTLKEIEIICVDDCSTDNSAQIMREYATVDKRIKNLFLPQNHGLSYVRNKALEIATGQYVSFVDSDDMLTHDALEKLYTIAEANDTDLQCFLPQLLLETSDSNYTNSYRDYPKQFTEKVYSGEYLFAKLHGKNHFYTSVCLKFFKRTLLKDNNITFIEGYIHEDNHFSVKSILLARRAIALNERLYIRRVRKNSIMTSADNQIHSFCGYAAQIGVLQSEIRQNIYSASQIDLVHKFCARIITVTLHGKNFNFNNDADWNLLPEELKKCPGNENWGIMLQIVRNIKQKNQQFSSSAREINKLKNSRSYRWGRKLTWLPRKIRQFFK